MGKNCVSEEYNSSEISQVKTSYFVFFSLAFFFLGTILTFYHIVSNYENKMFLFSKYLLYLDIPDMYTSMNSSRTYVLHAVEKLES